jgi:hypothetical protein
MTYHFCSLSARDGELEIGILLPEAEEERIALEELVVHSTVALDDVRARIAVDAALLGLGSQHKFLPQLVVFGIVQLCVGRLTKSRMMSRARILTYHLLVELLQLALLKFEALHGCVRSVLVSRSRRAARRRLSLDTRLIAQLT